MEGRNGGSGCFAPQRLLAKRGTYGARLEPGRRVREVYHEPLVKDGWEERQRLGAVAPHRVGQRDSTPVPDLCGGGREEGQAAA
jgi:hypothetical protein